MADTTTRRRRRLMLLVWTLVVALTTAAAWAVRFRLRGRPALDRDWHAPPSAPTPPPAAPPVPEPPAAVESPAAPPAPPAAMPAAPKAPRPSPTRRTREAARARAVPTATALPSVSADALPEGPFGPGSAPARADGSSPDPDYTIKGKTAARVFHPPTGPYYTRVRADVWFRTADDARAAGFTERVPRPRR